MTINSEYLQNNLELIKQIKQMPSFTPFNEKDIHGLLRLSKVMKYQPGERILREGSRDKLLYFLISGSVRIEKHGEDLAVLQRSGDVFGEMGIIDGSARSASAYAMENTICLSLDVTSMEKYSGEDHTAILYILYRIFSEFLATRLRQTNEELIKAREDIERMKGG